MFDQNNPSQPAVNTTSPTMPADPAATSAPVMPDPISTPAMPSTDPAPAADAPATDGPTGITLPDPTTPQISTPSAPADDNNLPAGGDVSTPDNSSDATPSLPGSEITPDTTPSISPETGGDDSLMAIKKDALQDLSPLLSQLEQTPEEKFRTTMMLIQASDDQSLLQSAYAAAKEITDEKVRAQALLDVVNEINYFSQNKAA